jgi:hypothetical protein
MRDWYLSEECEMPLWVCDLDDELYSVDHRRLCVWADETDGHWCWEIPTYEHSGAAASGMAATADDARYAAEAAARRLARAQESDGRP